MMMKRPYSFSLSLLGSLCVMLLIHLSAGSSMLRAEEAAKPKAASPEPLALSEIEAALKSGKAKELKPRIESTFGKWALDKGQVRQKLEKTVVGWAVKSDEPVTVVRVGEESGTIGEMTDLGGGLRVLVTEVENFQMLNHELRTASGKKLGGGNLKIESYEYTPDSLRHEGVPEGTVTKHEWNDSQVFPGTHREFLIYVPAQYKPEEPACLMVFQDGLRHADPDGPLRATVVMDNLIHQEKMPVTIGLFINPGAKEGQKPGAKPANRSFEYDSLGDQYARFLLEEMIPQVEKDYKLRQDPECWGIAGGSSGAACAWTVAWERPDKFRKVISWVGTFVDIRGANAYPSLIRKTEAKPIRVYLLDGSNDLDNQFGNWPLANKQMQTALEFMGYDYHWHFGQCFHGSNHAGAMLPEMLTWLWRGVE